LDAGAKQQELSLARAGEIADAPGNFRAFHVFKQCEPKLHLRKRKNMEKALGAGMWIVVAVYAAIGLFVVAVFHDIPVNMQRLSDGYGVSYATIAVNGAGTSGATTAEQLPIRSVSFR
jgi:hypothetical protein